MIAEDGFEWKTRVLASGPCVVHGDPSECELPMQAHHVLTSQSLRRHGFKHLIYETDNGVPACYKAHRQHHNRITPIRREQLPAAAIAFAEGVGLGWQITRYYPALDSENLGS